MTRRRRALYGRIRRSTSLALPICRVIAVVCSFLSVAACMTVAYAGGTIRHSRRGGAVGDEPRPDVGRLKISIKAEQPDGRLAPDCALIYIQQSDQTWYGDTLAAEEQFGRDNWYSRLAFHTCSTQTDRYFYNELRDDFYIRTEPNGFPRVLSGPTRIVAYKGTRFQVVDTQVTVTKGQETPVEIVIPRLPLHYTDLTGVYSADLHLHVNAFNQQDTPTSVILKMMEMMMPATDVDFGNFEAANITGTYVYNESQVRRWSQGSYASFGPRVVEYQAEFRNNPYGHLSVVGMESIPPFFAGYGPGADNAPDLVEDAVGFQHDGAFVMADHLHSHEGHTSAWDAPVLAALGLIDAANLGNSLPDELLETWDRYYRMLNAGVWLGAAAGSDIALGALGKLQGGHVWHFTSPPTHLTMVTTGTPGVDRNAMREHLKRGHSCYTDGPLLQLTVDGQSPGREAIIESAGPTTVQARVRMDSFYPVESCDLVVNGSPSSVMSRTTGFDVTVPLEIFESSWIAARCWGPVDVNAGWPISSTVVVAHTSPVRVLIDGHPINVPASGQEMVGEFNEFFDKVWPNLDFDETPPEDVQRILRNFLIGYEFYQAVATPGTPELRLTSHVIRGQDVVEGQVSDLRPGTRIALVMGTAYVPTGQLRIPDGRIVAMYDVPPNGVVTFQLTDELPDEEATYTMQVIASDSSQHGIGSNVTLLFVRP